MESQRQSILDREIKELSLKFNTEKVYLETQIRKLQEMNENKEKEITELHYQIQGLKI